MSLLVKYTLDPGAYAPQKAHDADAGFDLRLPDTYDNGLIVFPGESVVVDTGVHVAIPRNYVGFLKSKSGLNIKHNLRGEGVIDSGYTGSIVAKIYSDESRELQRHRFLPGDKVIQLVILPIPEVEMMLAESLDETERGDNGFGSTGR